VIPLPPELPRATGPIRRAIGRLWLSLMRWKVAGTIPNVPKLVIIVAPHTSNWDFVIGLATKLALGLRTSWLGKDSLFQPPHGWLFRFIEGIPVDRSMPQDLVSQSVAILQSRERVTLALAPEGTRRAGAEWRTGFWHIARGANVPILPVALDWETRTVRIGPAVQPGDDAVADIAAMKKRFAGMRGRHRSVRPRSGEP
jgi:1-acyl-sn-glycerol-3-phosphate acyltransferase